MGHFTDEMLRLREAANAAKQKRVDLIHHLQQGRQDLSDNVTTLLTNFRDDFTAQSQQRRSERQDFVNQLTATIAHLRDECHHAQQARAQAFAHITQTSRTNRVHFVSELKQNIAHLRQELIADQAEARRVWLGLSAVTQPLTAKLDKTIPEKAVANIRQNIIDNSHQVIQESETFVTGLKQSVSNMVRDFRTEIGGKDSGKKGDSNKTSTDT